MKPLPEHPLFKKLKRFDTDTEGQDPTPAPTAAARPAPPSRVPTRASAPATEAAPPPAPAPRILIPYRQMRMGERGYRNEDSVTSAVVRQWTNPERSPNRDRSFWVQR